MPYAVFFNNVFRNADPDADGAESLTIVAERAPIFQGDKAGALAALQSISVGTSVTLRHPKGSRSCMNKPALWEALENEY